MKHAIQFLKTELLADTHGAQIYCGEDTPDQADKCAARAAEFREAIAVLQRHEDRIGHNAGLLYDTYCKAVGGVAFNGDPLPDWDTFRADPGKRKQVEAWLAVGRTAAGDSGIVENPVFVGEDALREATLEYFEPAEQPTTIRGWLETLPDGYRERALANMLKGCSGTSKRSNLSDALAGAFTWVESPEGHDFWSTIRRGEGFPPLPEA